jgi:hypothetical protein
MCLLRSFGVSMAVICRTLSCRMDDMIAGHKYEGEILSAEVERLQAELYEAKKLSRPVSQAQVSAVARLESGSYFGALW